MELQQHETKGTKDIVIRDNGLSIGTTLYYTTEEVCDAVGRHLSQDATLSEDAVVNITRTTLAYIRHRGEQRDQAMGKLYNILVEKNVVEKVRKLDKDSLEILEKAKKRAEKDSRIAQQHLSFVRLKWGNTVFKKLEEAAKGQKTALQLKKMAEAAEWEVASRYLLKSALERIVDAEKPGTRRTPKTRTLTPGDIWRAQAMLQTAIEKKRVPNPITKQELISLGAWIDQDGVIKPLDDSDRIEELGDVKLIDLSLTPDPLPAQPTDAKQPEDMKKDNKRKDETGEPDERMKRARFTGDEEDESDNPEDENNGAKDGKDGVDSTGIEGDEGKGKDTEDDEMDEDTGSEESEEESECFCRVQLPKRIQKILDDGEVLEGRTEPEELTERLRAARVDMADVCLDHIKDIRDSLEMRNEKVAILRQRINRLLWEEDDIGNWLIDVEKWRWFVKGIRVGGEEMNCFCTHGLEEWERSWIAADVLEFDDALYAVENISEIGIGLICYTHMKKLLSALQLRTDASRATLYDMMLTIREKGWEALEEDWILGSETELTEPEEGDGQQKPIEGALQPGSVSAGKPEPTASEGEESQQGPSDGNPRLNPSASEEPELSPGHEDENESEESGNLGELNASLMEGLARHGLSAAAFLSALTNVHVKVKPKNGQKEEGAESTPKIDRPGPKYPDTEVSSYLGTTEGTSEADQDFDYPTSRFSMENEFNTPPVLGDLESLRSRCQALQILTPENMIEWERSGVLITQLFKGLKAKNDTGLSLVDHAIHEIEMYNHHGTDEQRNKGYVPASTRSVLQKVLGQDPRLYLLWKALGLEPNLRLRLRFQKSYYSPGKEGKSNFILATISRPVVRIILTDQVECSWNPAGEDAEEDPKEDLEGIRRTHRILNKGDIVLVSPEVEMKMQSPNGDALVFAEFGYSSGSAEWVDRVGDHPLDLMVEGVTSIGKAFLGQTHWEAPEVRILLYRMLETETDAVLAMLKSIESKLHTLAWSKYDDLRSIERAFYGKNSWYQLLEQC